MHNSFEKLFTLFKVAEVKVMVINDGSSVDIGCGIAELKRIFPAVRYVAYDRNQGKGYAIRRGLGEADSEYYIYTDWDFPFGEESVYQAYQLLKQHNADVLIGMRSKRYFDSLPLFRRIISRGLRVLSFFVLRFNHVDTQAGIKGLSNTARTIFLNNRTNSFIFELEFIRNCLRRKMNVSYLSVSPKQDITFSNFGFRTVSKEMAVLMRIIFT